MMLLLKALCLLLARLDSIFLWLFGLEGTNVELGKKILSQSGLVIQAADTLADAAQMIVAAVRGGH